MKIEISQETYNTLKEQILKEEIKVKVVQEKKLEIRNRWTGEVLYSSHKTTYREAVEEAVKNNANLSYADLYGADLYKANLYKANLYGANLSKANLYGANLPNANLSESNLSEADLSNANLYGADLYKANLSEANLSEASLPGAMFYGKGGTTKISKSQVDNFFQALGVIVGE